MRVSGFGVRVYATGRKVYVVQVRGRRASRNASRSEEHGKVAPDEARFQAADVIDRIRRGEDPFPPAPAPEPTMAELAELAERYVKAHLEVNCRPSTVKTFRRVLDLHILPELGHLPVASVERSHVSELHFRMRDKPVQANQDGGGAVQDVQAGRGLEHDAAEAQSLPVGATLQEGSPRAVPDAGGVSATREGAGRSRDEGRVPAIGNRGDPAAADRLPEERDRHAALGSYEKMILYSAEVLINY